MKNKLIIAAFIIFVLTISLASGCTTNDISASKKGSDEMIISSQEIAINIGEVIIKQKYPSFEFDEKLHEVMAEFNNKSNTWTVAYLKKAENNSIMLGGGLPYIVMSAKDCAVKELYLQK